MSLGRTIARPPAARAVRRRQGGMTLLQVTLVLVLLGSISAAGFQVLQSTRDVEHATGQQDVLAWADQAVAAFASAHSRLPCPAAAVNGEEDCSLGGKGYLPLTTLASVAGVEASMIGASGPSRLPGPVVYSVYRGRDAASDLARAEQRHAPLDMEGTARTIEGAPFDAINGYDFCQAILASAAAALDTSSTWFEDRDGNGINVAYGLAVAGPTPGDDGRFDRENMGDAIAIAPPWRGSDPEFDDRTRVRTFASLADVSGCRLLAETGVEDARVDMLPLAALDLVAEAVNIADTVKELQEATLDAANDAVQSGEMAVSFGAIGVTLGGVKIAATAIEIPERVGLLTANVTRCIASLGVECWRVPLSIASLATVGVALGLSIGALATQSAALAQTTEALADARTARRRADGEFNSDPADLDKAIEIAFVNAHGNCQDDGTPPPGQDECELGMEKRAAQLEEDARAAEADRDAIHAHYIRPWEDDRLHERIAGYDGMSRDAKILALQTARNQLQSARTAIDVQLEIDAANATLDEYDERHGQLSQMLDDTCIDPQTCYRASVRELCAKTDALSAKRCASAQTSLAYAETCERNGIYDPGHPDETPSCLPELDARKATILARIDTLEVQRDRARDAAKNLNVHGIMNRHWVEPVKDEDGNVVTPGYYRYTYPSPLRYPDSWFCYDGSCDIPFHGVWNWWTHGSHLPLLRDATFMDCSNNDLWTIIHCNAEWISYGDAYREYRLKKDVADELREQADEAQRRYQAAVNNYNQLLELKRRLGAGEPVELWLGADVILKAIDDRGTAGPDRNGTAPSAVLP